MFPEITSQSLGGKPEFSKKKKSKRKKSCLNQMPRDYSR